MCFLFLLIIYQKLKKFTFISHDFEYSITLNDILKDMNMILAFSENADFSNINRTISLYVSEVIQRTYIKVTETGTEVAAVSDIFIMATSPPLPHQIYDMNVVYHSFIYLIRDKTIKDVDNNELMLFIGSCNDFSNQNKDFKYFNNQDDDNDIDDDDEYDNFLKLIQVYILKII